MLRVEGSGFKVQASGFGVQGPGFRVPGSSSKFRGSRFKVQSFFLFIYSVWTKGAAFHHDVDDVFEGGRHISGFRVWGLGARS